MKPDLSLKLQAVKALNLLVNKHEYLKFTVRKAGRPSGFMLDTANACQLGCPSCQHSENKQWSSLAYRPMPAGVMKPDTFSTFIRKFGLRSYSGHFYNNSEPFLNKRTSDYVAAANLYRVRTVISSNMSVPRLDADAIVRSGLDVLMTAIDGTTQDVYQRYRKGGDLKLVLENVRRIVDSKRRMKSRTPYLRWQFLTFEHNIHQVRDASQLAMELGYDSFNVATPYDVSYDDPNVKAVNHPAGISQVFLEEFPAPWGRSLEPIADEIENAFSESLEARFQGREGIAHPQQGYCDWLHLGLISDAIGRIHPCCLPDNREHHSFVYGSVQDEAMEQFNSPAYLKARSIFAGIENGTKDSKCAGCHGRPLPQIGLNAVRSYLKADDQALRWSRGRLVASAMHDWSRHSDASP